MITSKDFPAKPTAWCPGCGNFGILTAVRRALSEMGLKPYEVLMVSGIGQAGKLPHYTRVNTLNELHGRTLPAAAAAKLVNPELTVIAVGGDGDGYGEGGNHFLHAVRRNHNLTYILHDNQVYGLTKGQASPTSDEGYVTKTTPFGAPTPVNGPALAIAAGGTFVARGFSGETEHLVELIKSGVRHKGFALIDVLQPCVTFNRKNTWKWYKDRVYKLEDTDYEPHTRVDAYRKALEWGDRIPLGIVYREERASFEDMYPALKEGPLVRQKLDPSIVEPLLKEFL
ncbi:MAG: 2-oxoacid ferredoxin oxidoreductase [Dehalococcoidia bacterium]|nr:2-oxoacid ferredoxin oxidoreductase [Dehalococcoidia bacterium]